MDLDRGAVGSGLAVYHCDILGSNELQQGTATRHYQCALLQADGRRDLELDENQGDGSDLFGPIGGTALSSTSAPHSREWDGRDSGLVISDITGPGPTITFSVGQADAGGHPLGRRRPDDDHPRQRASRASPAPSRSPGPGRSRRIKVGVDIEHTWIGDLRVTLTSPAGRTAVLHAQLGGSARRPRRHLRLGFARRAGRHDRPARPGRLGARRRRPRSPRRGDAQALDDRADDRGDRLTLPSRA